MLGSFSVQIKCLTGAMICSGLALVILVGVVRAQDVTTSTTTTKPTTTTTAPSSPVVKINDVCSNGCDSSDPSYWCGVNKKDENGRVVRCVELTVRGGHCVGACERKSQAYYWCMTNAVKVGGNAEWWDYCSPEGSTTNNEKCLDSCSRRGESYYYCHTSKEEKDKWDKCSPRGQVRPVQYTVKGVLCTSDCTNHGEKYYWCYKTQDHCSSGRGGSCDDSWDYCSVDERSTRYGGKCKDYNWCSLADGTWDYCSPSPRLGVDVSENIELTIYGVRCITKCRDGGGYYWCKQLGSKDAWDYCSPDKYTIHREKCKDRCTTRGKSYNWCNTASGWDYCSPAGTRGNIRESTTSAGDTILMLCILIPCLLIICITCAKVCR